MPSISHGHPHTFRSSDDHSVLEKQHLKKHEMAQFLPSMKEKDAGFPLVFEL